ncbi:MAG: phosphoglucosamine mutase [Chloroflexi bacterium]|nr:phosphoglucosamine mutase [Chloroflexota bacterium]
MEKLFGTDGIRGIANQFPLTPEFVTRIGSAIGQVIGRGATRPRALLGRDTRISGAMIEHALAAGLMAQGFDTLHVGVLATPGIAYLTRALGARCGISISASHNPFQDNGIKVFGADGFKIPDARENEIEMLAQTELGAGTVAEHIGQRHDETATVEQYFDFALSAVSRQPILRGKRVVVDCNHGATFRLAPRALRVLGAEVLTLNHEPDGVNINRGYDSLEPKLLRETVLRAHADWGVQFDGDGDRAVFVDERGNYVDGDFVLAILARDFQARGLFAARGNAVISTVMANVGLEQSLRAADIAMERTPVGDRWVTERMRASGAILGGEQSGHIVLFDGGHTTGDGLYTAIRVADVIVRSGRTLAELASCMTRYPQVLVNVRVPRKPPLEQVPVIQARVEHAREILGAEARILLRYSGTENLARVMIEGLDAAMIAHEANAIADVIRQTIT